VNIGDRIKETRESRNRTLLDVANFLGVTEATVQRYESGNIKNLKLDTISKIATFLKVDPAYLMGWKNTKENITSKSQYNYFPAAISAGKPINVEAITDNNVEKISIPDSIMGKNAGNKNIFITKVCGESMNKTMQDGSLIAVRPVALDSLKDGDIVVYSNEYEYSVKYFYDDKENKRYVFRPHSFDRVFADDIYEYDKVESLQIHGKVVLYIVELD